MQVGDEVITPFGYRKVIEARCTGESEVIEKFGLRATKDHHIYINNIGFSSIGDLCYNASINKLTFMEVLKWRFQKLLCLTAGVTISEQRESIIFVQKCFDGKFLIILCIETFGNFIITWKFLKAMRFIISTVILSITTLTTLSVYRWMNIVNILKELIGIFRKNISHQLDHWHLSGMEVKKADCGIKNMSRIRLGIENLRLVIVNGVQKSINIFLRVQDSVQHCVLTNTLLGRMAIKENALFVEQFSILQRQGINKHVVLNVEENTKEYISKKRINAFYALKNLQEELDQPELHAQDNVRSASLTKETVFNITVESEGVYYANGVLVSNCDSLSMLVCQMRAFAARSEPRREKYNMMKRNNEYQFNPMTA